MPLATPDLTRAQLLAVAKWAAAQAVAFGWVSAGHEQTLISVGSTVLAAVWVAADAAIRHGRSVGLASTSQSPGAGSA